MKPLFPLIPALSAGLRHLVTDWRFLSQLAAFPVLIGFAAMLAIQFLGLGDQLFWASIVKVPSDFITGIFLAIYVRFLVFREMPAAIANNQRTQYHITLSTLLFTSVSFVFTGIAAGTLMMMNGMSGGDVTAPTGDPKTLILALVAMVVTIWIQRYQWLPIAAAAGYPVRPFITFLGGSFGLSVRIFSLWIVASLPAFIIMNIIESIMVSMSGAGGITDLNGPALWLVMLVRAVAATITGIITTAASVYAIRHCMQGRGHDV